MAGNTHTIEFQQVTLKDIEQVGGKNASLGEMIVHLSSVGIAVPQGFATTAYSFRQFLAQNGLDEQISAWLLDLDPNDIPRLQSVSQNIRQAILQTPFPSEFEEAVRRAYQNLSDRIGQEAFSVAVRSSATAEDLPEASFAGQQETILNVRTIDEVLTAILQVYASLYHERAISYRIHHQFAHDAVALSVGVQQMVRSDLATSGVMFTIDTESGFDKVVFVTASYGLGEMVVQGAINPDEFYVYKEGLKQGVPAILRRTLGAKQQKMIYSQAGKETVQIVPVSEQERLQFCLSEEEVLQLAHMALKIEAHYGKPMDIEWAKDGISQQLYIVQARPETVASRSEIGVMQRYMLQEKGPILCEGRSIGQRIGQGKATIIRDIHEMDKLAPGDVLVADMTDPDWEPIMKRASAIVTNRGGRTCHAAIIARELGIPAVVGCHDATKQIEPGMEVTVSCAEGDTGFVYQGLLPFQIQRLDVTTQPKLPVKIMLNVGNPDRAFAFQAIPNAGVGLARLEFLISNTIGIHPKALLHFETLQDAALKAEILKKIQAYPSPEAYYVERLKEGVATIAAAFYPKPVIVRLSDFKSNEYANLMGGSLYEPDEENPMLGFRGAARYISSTFNECFALECRAIRLVREEMGLSNVEVMIPFVRTVKEAEAIIEQLKQQGLERGKHQLRLIMMCEIPSNALLAKDFLNHFDGFSIGSNDLTQLTLGVDRDSALMATQFDERDEAVKVLLHQAIAACKNQGKYIGICGQGPSDHPDFADWLVAEGIDSLSLNPDSVLETSLYLAKNHHE